MSRISAELDRDLEAFRTRRLEGGSPTCFSDATYVKARVKGRVVSRAVVVATGVTRTGDQEVLGVEVGDSEDWTFWTSFLRGLGARGLAGLQLVISDHHLGLKAAIAAVFIGSSWQRSSVEIGGAVDNAAVGMVPADTPPGTPPGQRGPWERDLRGPAGDLSLSPVAGPLLASGSCAWEHRDERPDGHADGW